MNLARRGTTGSPRRSKPTAPPPAHALIELVPTGSIAKLAAGGRYVLEVAGARVEEICCRRGASPSIDYFAARWQRYAVPLS